MNDTPGNARKDDNLAETVDMIGEVVGIMSGRIDDQSKLLVELHKSAVETRHAAAAARSNTDPGRYGELIAETISGELGQSLADIKTVTHELKHHSQLLQNRIEQELQDKQKATNDLYNRQIAMAHREADLPRKLILSTLAALILGIVVTRLALGTELGCKMLFSRWIETGAFCSIDPLSEWWNGR